MRVTNIFDTGIQMKLSMFFKADLAEIKKHKKTGLLPSFLIIYRDNSVFISQLLLLQLCFLFR